MKRSAISDAFAQALEPILLRLANFITVIVQDRFAIVTLDGEDFREDGLQAQIPSLAWRNFGLQKFTVRIDLHLDEIRWRNDFFNLAKVNSFCCFRWHFVLCLLVSH